MYMCLRAPASRGANDAACATGETFIFIPGPLAAEDGPLSCHSSATDLRMFDIDLRLAPKPIKIF